MTAFDSLSIKTPPPSPSESATFPSMMLFFSVGVPAASRTIPPPLDEAQLFLNRVADKLRRARAVHSDSTAARSSGIARRLGIVFNQIALHQRGRKLHRDAPATVDRIIMLYDISSDGRGSVGDGNASTLKIASTVRLAILNGEAMEYALRPSPLSNVTTLLLWPPSMIVTLFPFELFTVMLLPEKLMFSR